MHQQSRLAELTVAAPSRVSHSPASIGPYLCHYPKQQVLSVVLSIATEEIPEQYSEGDIKQHTKWTF